MTFIFLLLEILQSNPNFHIIEKGETLYSISKTKGIPLELLMKKNQFNDTTVIGIGDTIYFPTNQEITDLNG